MNSGRIGPSGVRYFCYYAFSHMLYPYHQPHPTTTTKPHTISSGTLTQHSLTCDEFTIRQSNSTRNYQPPPEVGECTRNQTPTKHDEATMNDAFSTPHVRTRSSAHSLSQCGVAGLIENTLACFHKHSSSRTHTRTHTHAILTGHKCSSLHGSANCKLHSPHWPT